MTATIERLSSARAAELAGISYRQLDLWARRGLSVGTGHGSGSGSRRTYTTDDVRLLRFIDRLSRLLPVGRGQGDRTMTALILVPVVEAIQVDPTILDRPLVFVSADGTITNEPTHGWVVRGWAGTCSPDAPASPSGAVGVTPAPAAPPPSP